MMHQQDTLYWCTVAKCNYYCLFIGTEKNCAGKRTLAHMNSILLQK